MRGVNLPALTLGFGALVLGVFAAMDVLRSWSRLRGRILCLGDSVTAHGGFIRVLQQTFPHLTFENAGVVGESTAAILSRASRLLTPGTYAGVIVMGGLNDGDRPASWTEGNLSAIYRLAKASGARVAALTETPVWSYPNWTSGAQARQEVARRWVLSKPTGVDVVVNVWTPLRKTEYAAPDGLHLNATGQAKLGQIVVRALR